MKSFSRRQRGVMIGVFAIFATAFTFMLMAGPFSYSSVCGKCGASRRTTDWQLPLTGFTVFTYLTEAESPLSRVLLTNRIVSAHTHDWVFAQGGGNSVQCAIGEGRHIRPAAESEEFAALVLLLHRRGQIAFRDRVLRGVFDPETSELFRSLSFSAPKATVSEAEMQSWIAEQSRFLDEMAAGDKK